MVELIVWDHRLLSSHYRIEALIFHSLTVFENCQQKPPDQRKSGIHSVWTIQTDPRVADAVQTHERYLAGEISVRVGDASGSQWEQILLCCHLQSLSEPSLIIPLFVCRGHSVVSIRIHWHTHKLFNICNPRNFCVHLSLFRSGHC